MTLNRIGKDQEAIQQLEKALKIDGENINALVTLGFTLNKINRKIEAISPLKQALTLDPDNLNAYTTLGMIYDELKMHSASDSLYDTALIIFPENDLLLNNYAYSLADRGIRLKEALEMSKKAISMQPENGAYLDTIGWIYYKLKQFNLALQYIKQSLDTREESAVVIQHLGDVYYEMGDHDNAKINWKKAFEMDPESEKLKDRIESN